MGFGGAPAGGDRPGNMMAAGSNDTGDGARVGVLFQFNGTPRTGQAAGLGGGPCHWRPGRRAE